MAQAKVARIEVRRQLSPDLPRFLANANQIQQVIVNLAANAFDAMENGGILTVTTHNLRDGPLSWIVLKITDTGLGIVVKSTAGPYLAKNRFEGTSSKQQTLKPPAAIPH